MKKSIIALALALLFVGGISLFVHGENPPLDVRASIVQNA